MSKTWFITGAGRGFGHEFTEAALRRGDRVAATARDLTSLSGFADEFGEQFLPLQLDVTDRDAAFDAVRQAHETFGRLDVIVNNAGYGLFGAVEELTAEQLQRQLDVNLFGVLHVTQAALPLLREQGSGHIIQISTVGGVTTFPTLGGYHASKWALEGLTEALAKEVAQFGIAVTLVEPGGYATDWAGASAVTAAPNAAYDGLRNAMQQSMAQMPANAIGDPKATGPAILAVADAEQPPLRVFFGTQPVDLIPSVYAERLATWDAWRAVSVQAQGHQD